MGLRNSPVLLLREAFPVPLFSRDRMGRCVVPPIVHSIHKSARCERNGSLRVLYAARIGHCRACPLREQCQESATAIKARRGSRVYWPVSSYASTSDESSLAPEDPSSTLAPHPVLWGDWPRRSHRRELVKLLRHQRIDIRVVDPSPPAQAAPARPFSRAERAHYRLSWAERLARNARAQTASKVSIRLFGIPPAFATFLGLSIV